METRSALSARWVAAAVAALSLSACGGANDDLRAYIDDVKARPGGRIEPLPPIEPAPTFAYEPGARRSPFMPDEPAARRATIQTPSKGPIRTGRASCSRSFRSTRCAWSARSPIGARASASFRPRTGSCGASPSAITWDRTTAASWPSRILRFNWWRSSPTVSAGTWNDPPRLAWPIEAQGSFRE